MKRDLSNDIFNISVRLFREFQLKEKLSAKDTVDIFNKYRVFDYIETCYELYHVQGDDANLSDIIDYLNSKGWKK